MIDISDAEHIEKLEPTGIDPNAGWAVWVMLPDGREFAQFDFIRNRGRSLKLLGLAGEYLATVQSALAAGHVGPAVETALAAAELAITAQTYSSATGDPDIGGRRNSDSARRRWTKVQVGLGNAPDAQKTLVALNGLRRACRYGEGEPPSADRAGALVASAQGLVDGATSRVGQRTRPQSPESTTRPPTWGRPCDDARVAHMTNEPSSHG